MQKLCLLILILIPVLTSAAIEEYAFESPEEEERFKQLIYEMRCPKCLNSNLAGSDAPIAADLRQEIYDQVSEGRSTEEIVEFMSSRYGDFILYRPRLTAGTMLLWFGPPLLLIFGFLIVRQLMKRSQLQPVETGLTKEEEEKLAAILASSATEKESEVSAANEEGK